MSAGTAERRDATSAEAERLAAAVSWPRLADMLQTRRLLSRLGPRILTLAGGQASEDFSAAVRDSLLVGRRRGACLQLVGAKAWVALAQAGIPSALLKGPLLSEALYGDPGCRASGDVDLLVAPGQLREAVQAVRGLGYSAPAAEQLDSRGLPALHFVLVHEREELPPIELHWRVHWYEERFAQERLLPVDLAGGHAWRPAAVDELAALLLFFARDGFVDLRLASDLAAWWDIHDGRLAQGAVVELLRGYPALSRALEGSLWAAERVVGLPAGHLLGSRRSGARPLLAERLASPNPRASEPQLYAQMGLVDGLLAPAGGFGAFARRQLLPSREVRDGHARRRGRVRRRSSCSRAAGMLLRYVVAFAGLARRHEARASRWSARPRAIDLIVNPSRTGG